MEAGKSDCILHERYLTLLLNAVLPCPRGPFQETVKCQAPLIAKFDFTRYVPVWRVGVISESPAIGAILGIDILEPSWTSQTLMVCPFGSRNWTTNWFCPCLSSPALFRSTMATSPTTCVATSFRFSVSTFFAPQPVKPRIRNNIIETTDSFFMGLSPWSELRNHEIVSVETV